MRLDLTLLSRSACYGATVELFLLLFLAWRARLFFFAALRSAASLLGLLGLLGLLVLLVLVLLLLRLFGAAAAPLDAAAVDCDGDCDSSAASATMLCTLATRLHLARRRIHALARICELSV